LKTPRPHHTFDAAAVASRPPPSPPLAVGVPAAGAAVGVDPAIYDAGVAPGQVEHGTVAFTITGAPTPQNRHTEYWLSADRW
jgi:hypothetical protein